MPEKNLDRRRGHLKLADVCVEVSDRIANPSESEYERFVGLEHMDTGDTKLRKHGSTADLVSAMKLFKHGDVLVARRNVYLKRASVANFDGVCSGDAIVLRHTGNRLVIPGLLPHLLNTDRFWDYAIKHAAGTMSKRLSVDKLLQYEFAVPTVDEQQRILDATESLEECYETYQSLAVHGKALLKSLLDRMWNTFPKRKIGSLVEERLIAPPQDGNHGEKHPKASDYVTDGVPFVMASDLRDGKIDFVTCNKIPEALARTLRIGFARSGDVLLSHKGTVGEVARIGDLATDFVMLTPQVTYYRVIDQSRLMPEWLYFAFQTPGFKRLLDQYGKQSTRAYVGITTQRELSVPMAAPGDQSLFISELVAAEKALSTIAIRASAIVEMRRRLLAEALS